MHSQSKHPKIHHHIVVISWPLKFSKLSLKNKNKTKNKIKTKEKKYFSVNYIYILYIYTFVLLYQPNIMYFLCCYGRGPWQHHGNGTIKIKTLIPQLHPAREFLFLFICCVFPSSFSFEHFCFICSSYILSGFVLNATRLVLNVDSVAFFVRTR